MAEVSVPYGKNTQADDRRNYFRQRQNTPTFQRSNPSRYGQQNNTFYNQNRPSPVCFFVIKEGISRDSVEHVTGYSLDKMVKIHGARIIVQHVLQMIIGDNGMITITIDHDEIIIGTPIIIVKMINRRLSRRTMRIGKKDNNDKIIKSQDDGAIIIDRIFDSAQFANVSIAVSRVI